MKNDTAHYTAQVTYMGTQGRRTDVSRCDGHLDNIRKGLHHKPQSITIPLTFHTCPATLDLLTHARYFWFTSFGHIFKGTTRVENQKNEECVTNNRNYVPPLRGECICLRKRSCSFRSRVEIILETRGAEVRSVQQ